LTISCAKSINQNSKMKIYWNSFVEYISKGDTKFAYFRHSLVLSYFLLFKRLNAITLTFLLKISRNIQYLFIMLLKSNLLIPRCENEWIIYCILLIVCFLKNLLFSLEVTKNTDSYCIDAFLYSKINAILTQILTIILIKIVVILIPFHDSMFFWLQEFASSLTIQKRNK